MPVQLQRFRFFGVMLFGIRYAVLEPAHVPARTSESSHHGSLAPRIFKVRCALAGALLALRTSTPRNCSRGRLSSRGCISRVCGQTHCRRRVTVSRRSLDRARLSMSIITATLLSFAFPLNHPHAYSLRSFHSRSIGPGDHC